MAGPGRRTRGWGIALFLVAVAGVAMALLARPRPDPASLRERALSGARSENWAEADEALIGLSRLRPLTSDELLLAARAESARGRLEEAIARLGEIRDVDPNGPSARLLTGQIELRRHRGPAAEAALRRALALDPKLDEARRALLHLYGIQQRPAELDAQFLALSERAPLPFDQVFHWCSHRGPVNDPEKVRAEIERFLNADPDDRWSRLALAENHRQRGRLDEAESTLKTLPDSDPEARAARAALALERGENAKADALLGGGPSNHAELARLRGRQAMARRDWKAAERHFRIALATDPDNRDNLFGLGQSLRLAGEEASAVPYLKAMRAREGLGVMIQRTASAMQRGSVDPKLLRELGAAHAAAGRRAQARAWYRLAVARDPLDAEAQRALFRLETASAESPIDNPNSP